MAVFFREGPLARRARRLRRPGTTQHIPRYRAQGEPESAGKSWIVCGRRKRRTLRAMGAQNFPKKGGPSFRRTVKNPLGRLSPLSPIDGLSLDVFTYDVTGEAPDDDVLTQFGDFGSHQISESSGQDS